MAKFLNTSGITHQLEEIIKGSQGQAAAHQPLPQVQLQD